MSRPFDGVYTIMPTPFDDGGALDHDSLASLTDFLVGLGVDGVVVLGVMGEAPKLSDAEQEAVLATTVEAAQGRIPVYTGSSAAGTDLAIAKAARFVELGASGLLVAPPPVQNDGVIFEHYRRLGEAVDSPIILHDYPATTGILLSPELVVRLHAEIDAVEVIKLEAPPTGPKVSRLRDLGSDIGIVGGLGGAFFIEELDRGADGMMTGLSYPDLLVAIHRAYRAGDVAHARELFYRACPLLRYEFQPGIGLALRKEVYRKRGAIRSPFVRYPGAQIDDRMRSELQAVLDHCRLDEVTA
jgi:4-hydroxy-tetrahydrodipicolinate synthase